MSLRATTAEIGCAHSDASAARSVILVAGMHRSGTSVFTRTLSLLGCSLPKTTLSTVWESRAVIRLDEHMLASAGCGWDDWKPFAADCLSNRMASSFRRRAEATLRDEFGSASLCLLKDPRLCRLLPVWLGASENLGIAPVVILPIRNPLEVAASLEARDGIDPSIGQLLWLRYVLDAEHASRGFRRALFRYDHLIADWRAVVEGLSETLGITWPTPLAAAAIEVEPCISPTKRHHQMDDARVFGDPTLSSWLKSTFEILSRWTQGEIKESDAAELDRIRSNFDDAAGLFTRTALASRPLFHQRLAKLETKLEKRDVRIRTLTAKLAAKRNRMTAERRASMRLRHSISWRVTRPLRLMARVSRRLRQMTAL